jgi:hypothetical protein
MENIKIISTLTINPKKNKKVLYTHVTLQHGFLLPLSAFSVLPTEINVMKPGRPLSFNP